MDKMIYCHKCGMLKRLVHLSTAKTGDDVWLTQYRCPDCNIIIRFEIKRLRGV